MDHLKYLLSLFFPVCVACFLYTGPHGIYTAIVWTTPLWILIFFDWQSPKVNLKNKSRIVSHYFYDAILYSLAFLQFLIIFLLLRYASQLQWESAPDIATSLVNLWVMRIMVGTSSGSSAIIVAHELIHRSKYHLRVLGRLLLYTVCYEHFVIAHLRGHHLSVATPEDIATARLDESFDAYWKRVTLAHFKYAWRSELRRLGLRSTSGFHLKIFASSVLQGVIVEGAMVILIIIVFGWAAAIIFLYQALSGVRLLETINYYQHWGLQQGRAVNNLAWINTSQVTYYALLGLSNHIAHHNDATTPFYETPYSAHGPTMCDGYFVTNLWVKLKNSSYRHESINRLKDYFLEKTIN